MCAWIRSRGDDDGDETGHHNGWIVLGSHDIGMRQSQELPPNDNQTHQNCRETGLKQAGNNR
jgi:hypothetical protein